MSKSQKWFDFIQISSNFFLEITSWISPQLHPCHIPRLQKRAPFQLPPNSTSGAWGTRESWVFGASGHRNQSGPLSHGYGPWKASRLNGWFFLLNICNPQKFKGWAIGWVSASKFATFGCSLPKVSQVVATDLWFLECLKYTIPPLSPIDTWGVTVRINGDEERDLNHVCFGDPYSLFTESW